MEAHDDNDEAFPPVVWRPDRRTDRLVEAKSREQRATVAPSRRCDFRPRRGFETGSLTSSRVQGEDIVEKRKLQGDSEKRSKVYHFEEASSLASRLFAFQDQELNETRNTRCYRSL